MPLGSSSRNSDRTFKICTGGMFLAVFFFASNIIPPFYIVPNIPVTLQIMVVALMGGFLGVKWGLLDLLALYIATLAGLPMMSSFHGGPAAFLTPTAGFIFGWVFLTLLAGLCRDFIAPRMVGSRGKRYFAAMTVCCVAGVLLDYAAGALWFVMYSHLGMAAFAATFASFMAYLPLDAIKCAAAAGLCAVFLRVPALARAAHIA